MSATLVAPRSVDEAAEALNHARLGAALPCRDDVEGMETPGLVSEDWTDEDSPRTAEAAVACMRCPVVEQCGTYALLAREAYGVWGGMTAGERRKLLRRRGVRLTG